MHGLTSDTCSTAHKLPDDSPETRASAGQFHRQSHRERCWCGVTVYPVPHLSRPSGLPRSLHAAPPSTCVQVCVDAFQQGVKHSPCVSV